MNDDYDNSRTDREMLDRYSSQLGKMTDAEIGDFTDAVSPPAKPERKTYVYRLLVKYPDGSKEPGWRPAYWSDPQFLAGLSRKQRRELAKAKFRWPRVRRCLSSSTAYQLAWRLQSYGARVTIRRSMPVQWSDRPDTRLFPEHEIFTNW
jgi:hypothetical protein